VALRRGPLPIALLALSAAPAHAGGLSLDLLSPRGVGRAGAGVVSDDGAAAVIVNPAGLARRDELRVQGAVVVVDDAATFDPPGTGVVATERGTAAVSPVLGAQRRVGPVVIGVAMLDEARWSRRFASPEPGTPPDDVEALYPHRYGGLALAHRRRTLGAAAAWRATEWLAVGAGLTVSRVELAETRRLWAGFDGRDRIGDAARDVELTVGGDALVVGGSIGVLVAPIDVPIELAASATWSGDAALAGEASARAVRPGEFPTVSDGGATAAATMASPLVVRTGARWLGEQWIAELDGEVWAYPTQAGAPAIEWDVDGVTVTDDTGAGAVVVTVPSRASRRGHGAVRAAVDVEAVPGLVWLTAGYAFATAASARAALTPVGGDPGGHTIAAGAEIATDGFTVTLGVARTLSAAATVDVSTVALDNPFAAGTAPATLGVHDSGRDQVAVTVEGSF
jgi:hypothetical protein